jgi:protein-S-isoprenylcysteine O-methyltransferase Ste14
VLPSPQNMAGGPPRSRLARGLILATASALVIALVLGAGMLDARLGVGLPAGMRLPGLAGLAFGLAIIGWAEVTLLRIARSTGGFGDPPPTLVSQGPYRHVRNPIYVGAFGLLLGLAMYRGSPTLLASALAFLPVMHVFIVRVEEPATRRRLGASYDEYRRRVPRWLPWPRTGVDR